MGVGGGGETGHPNYRFLNTAFGNRFLIIFQETSPSLLNTVLKILILGGLTCIVLVAGKRPRGFIRTGQDRRRNDCTALLSACQWYYCVPYFARSGVNGVLLNTSGTNFPHSSVEASGGEFGVRFSFL